MRRAIGIGIAAALLAVPATAPAQQPTNGDRQNAAKDCRAERADIGVEAYREKYGTNRNNRNAHGKCVSQGARALARERKAERRNAARDCREERGDIGVQAFREKYGTNRNNRNAFGKCVSQTVKANRQAEAETEPETEPEA